MKRKNAFRVYIKITLLALIVGLVYVFPHILFIVEMKKDFHLFFIDTPDEEIYAGRIREIYDGRYLIKDAYIYENKSKPYVRTSLSELTMGLLGKIFNLPINQLFIFADFIFPITIFLLVLYFLFIVTRSLNLALFGSVMVIFGDFIDIIYCFIIKHEPFFLIFSRLINPQVHFIYFMLSLIFTYRVLKNSRTVNIVLAGLFFGLLFYTYPYFWSFFLVVYLLLVTYFIFKKDFPSIKAILYIIIEGLIISLPYWVNYIHLSRLPYYLEIVTRIGLFHAHRPLILKLPLISIIIFLLYKRRDFNFYFIFSLLVSVFLCMNQQIITGRELEPFQWYWCPGRQIMIISWIILIYNFLINNQDFLKRFSLKLNYKLFGKYLFITFLTLNIIMHFSVHVFNYEKMKQRQKGLQFLHEPFLWLNKNTKFDDVVLASNEVSLLIPVFTHNNVYRTPYIYETILSDVEIIDRFLIFSRLFGVSKSKIIEYVINHKSLADIDSEFFGNRSLDLRYKNKKEFYISNKIEEKITERYRLIVEKDIYTLLGQFRVDYIFYSPYEKEISNINLDKYQFLKKVYDKDNVQIYQFIRTNVSKV